MLLSRYNNIDYIHKLDIVTGVELLKKAYEKRHEERMFTLWSNRYPHMTQENYISFEDFLASTKQPIDKRSAQQIVDDITKTYAKTEWAVK